MTCCNCEIEVYFTGKRSIGALPLTDRADRIWCPACALRRLAEIKPDGMTLDEIGAALPTAVRGGLDRCARSIGLRLFGSATSPFSRCVADESEDEYRLRLLALVVAAR